MKQIYADLHNHTTASDGDFSPAQMVEKAHKIGLGAIAITDHDTDHGIEEAIIASQKNSIEVIPGVEVSIRFKRPYFTGTLHLLCYFSRNLSGNQIFRDDLSQVLSKGRGIELVNNRVNEINRVFGPSGLTPLLKKELLAAQILEYSANATRRHFALALAQKHQIDDKKVINQMIGNASPAYLPSGVDLATIVPFLEKYRLMTVLAHPAAGSFPGEGHYKEVLPPLEIVEKLLPEFLDSGLKGLEVYYPGHIKSHEEIMKAWAKKYHLQITGGSDCHDSEERPLGVAGITQDQFLTFKELLS